MREPLNILDSKEGAFLRLSDLLPILPVRAATTTWAIEDFVEPDGERYFDWIADVGHNRLAAAVDGGERLSTAQLLAVALDTRQVVWGSFKGYDASGGVEPWIVLSAVDSSFWEVVTDDLETRRRIRTTFKDVRKGKM